jgi:hypothetical protein
VDLAFVRCEKKEPFVRVSDVNEKVVSSLGEGNLRFLCSEGDHVAG